MRTNIVLDDKLIAQVMKDGDFSSRRAAVEEGLKMLLRLKAQKKIRSLQGKIRWEGNLSSMRLDLSQKRQGRAPH